MTLEDIADELKQAGFRFDSVFPDIKKEGNTLRVYTGGDSNDTVRVSEFGEAVINGRISDIEDYINIMRFFF